ncbi:hypothetical protein D9757_002338 [Collybiopsis confluens]|uniref:Endonuclease/exonuclease/phosphatase domain-containing protein n=1 Tax=Collybiopsis confluens TaxID=2823264 RepID=A0A8H5HY90_9AGAR|nr:hypothetical protein D9757_002338 [Collybiopsis confluens]
MFSSSTPQNELHGLRFYRFHPRRNCWKHVVVERESGQHLLHHEIGIITWNVDFYAGKVVERMNGVLDYLQHKILKGRPFAPCVIMLQEVHSKALPVIRTNAWVQKHFYITPIDNMKWASPHIHGNITLVERSLSIKGTGILHYAPTNMARTALFTDIRLAPLEPERYQGKREIVVRIVNTHLESLKDGNGAEYRAEQLALCVELLDEDPAVYTGVIGGDFNAIDEDSTDQIHQHGLRDPGEPSELTRNEQETHTWGFHEKKPSEFPTGRLDKIVYRPRGEVSLQTPVIIGQDAKADEGDWLHLSIVTGHYRLRKLTPFWVRLPQHFFFHPPTTTVLFVNMKAVIIASAVALLSGAYAQDFSINTPPLLSNGRVELPLTFCVYNAGNPSATAEDLGQQNTTSFTWQVNIAAGQSVGFNIVDNTGATKQSAAVAIQNGSSSSCIGQSASGSAGTAAPTSASSGGSTAAASGSTAASTTGAGSSSTSKSGSSSTSSAAASTTSASNNNSAISQAAQVGVAGVVGAAIIALLA